MSWRDDLRQGSFRGVQFFIESHSFNSGRRNVDHEFPTREQGNSEDLGKRLPRYSINLFVLGEDYFSQRDSLREALDTEGPGELVHPYLGDVLAQVGEYTLDESRDQGRMAKFTVQFIEAGAPVFPEESTDAVQGVLASVEETLEATQAVFATAMSVANSPARVVESASSAVNNAADKILDIVDEIGSGADAIAEVAFSIANIKQNVNSLLSAPSQLAERFKASFDLLFEAIDDEDDTRELAQSIFRNTSEFSQDAIVDTGTPTVKRQIANQAAIENLIVELSLANQAKAAVGGTYNSTRQALDVLGQFNSAVEPQLERISDDDLYQKLKDIEVQMNRALPPQNTGNIVEFTPPKTLPALVISHALFGDIDKEQEIIDQNEIRHPGFVPGGLQIEVSSE